MKRPKPEASELQDVEDTSLSGPGALGPSPLRAEASSEPPADSTLPLQQQLGVPRSTIPAQGTPRSLGQPGTCLHSQSELQVPLSLD